jgi:hypothetical protein
VSIEIKLGIKDVPDNSLLVDDVSHATGKYKQGGGYAIELPDSIVRIAEEGEGKSIFSSKLLVGCRVIGANANYFRSRFLKDFVAVPEGTRLSSASRRIVFGIEVEDNRFLPQQVAEVNGSTGLVGEGKGGGAISHLQG